MTPQVKRIHERNKKFIENRVEKKGNVALVAIVLLLAQPYFKQGASLTPLPNFFQLLLNHDSYSARGGSSIVKVPGDVPPTRVYF